MSETATQTPDDGTVTVTLTDRAPVRIVKDDWPQLTRAEDRTHDGGEHESQATRNRLWRLIVRQHADGRALVYGVYRFWSQWTNERNANVRGGLLVAPGFDLVAAIQLVATDMAGRCPGDDGTWDRLAQECVGGLPVEDLP